MRGYPDRDPQLFYELARDRHASQSVVLDLLDSKLNFYLTSSGALVSLLVAVYALRPDEFDGWRIVLPAASGAAWLLLTRFALCAVRPNKWEAGPMLQDVYDSHFSKDDDATLKWRAACHFWSDYDKNKSLMAEKVDALKLSQRLFIIQTALLVAALSLVALSDSGTSRHSPRRSVAARDVPVHAAQGRLVPAREDRAVLERARLRSSRPSLTLHYAASEMASRVQWSACASRASITRSA
jgi:hypothetical protein